MSAFRKVRAKRVLEVSETPGDLDFDDVRDTAEVDEQPSVLSRGVGALAVTSLALLTVAGVAVAASAGSDRVDTAAVSTDKNAKDITRGNPAPDANTIEQQVQQQVSQARKASGQKDGTLAAFAGRTTITRSAARTELSRAVANTDANQRQDSLDQQSKTVAEVATDTGAAARDDQIAADLARVRAEATRIAAEKKAAEAKLKAAKAAGQLTQTSTKTGAAPTTAAGSNASITSGGGTTPIAPGSYTLGASWGQYGSWARWHTGQDFPAAVGTPVRAVADGVASTSCGGCQGWAGDSVMIINHANGASTLYAHLDRYTVQPGAIVKAGQVIGYVGMKGRTFGPHLHFEYYPKGATPGDVYKTQNPITFLLSLGVHA